MTVAGGDNLATPEKKCHFSKFGQPPLALCVALLDCRMPASGDMARFPRRISGDDAPLLIGTVD